jgi:hypothetical protein
MERLDAAVKVIRIGKLTLGNAFTGLGAPLQLVDDAIAIGPARTRLLWRSGWTWRGLTWKRIRPQGLRGGPMISITLPFGLQGHDASFESRLSSFTYAFDKLGTRRLLLEELADPHHTRRSVEVGLYLNVSLGQLL